MTHQCRRVMALIDFDGTGLDVARAARKLAMDNDAALALGHVSTWDWGSTHGLQPSVLSADALSCQTPLLTAQLREIAAAIGYGNAPPLVALAPTRKQGINQLAAGWQPDVLMLGAGSAIGYADGQRISVNTGFNSANPLVRIVEPVARDRSPAPWTDFFRAWLRP